MLAISINLEYSQIVAHQDILLAMLRIAGIKDPDSFASRAEKFVYM